MGDYELQGVESFAPAAADARARGIQVYASFFEDADIEDRSIDVVLMWHVLEHVFDPVIALQKVARILKPGGLLMIYLLIFLMLQEPLSEVGTGPQ